MAPRQIKRIFVCHHCLIEFSDRPSLISHLEESCLSHPSNHENNRIPRLNKNEQQILQMLNLKRSVKSRSLRSKSKVKPIETNKTYSVFAENSFFIESMNENDSERCCNTNNRINHLHTYKYSRREQLNFYSSVKRARLKKNFKSFVSNSSKIDVGPFSIDIPTNIFYRQRLNSNTNKNYPLILDPNFDSLVKLSDNVRMKSHRTAIHRYFNLLHSIASQEFQLIVHSHDYDRCRFRTNGRSFIEILRETMFNYSTTVRPSFNENYFRLNPPTNETQIDRSKSTPIEEKISFSSTSNQKNVDKVRTRTDSNKLEPKPVSLSTSQLSQGWSNKNIFYRCHACSHEQFFSSLSRECLNLHLSSNHVDNEDNFKQQLSNYLNRQGRSLKIVQHYLKWQKPWTETEIERIFHLSDSNTQRR